MNLDIEIKFDCEYEDFYKVAECIEKMGFSFTVKVDGFDTLYWEFDFYGINLTLCYNIYEGISLFLKDSETITEVQKKLVENLADNLKKTC